MGATSRCLVRVLRFSADTVTSADPAASVHAEKHGDEWSVDVNGF